MKNLMMLIFCILGVLFFIPSVSYSHCDTMDGPVIIDAKQALDNNDITPVLKWVKKDDEGKVKDAFNKTIKNRVKDEKAKEKADMHFFEVLVKIHRTGEGAKFSGIKSQGHNLEPAIVEADKALQSDSANNLVSILTKDMSEKINSLFNDVVEKKKHINDSIEAGREYGSRQFFCVNS